MKDIIKSLLRVRFTKLKKWGDLQEKSCWETTRFQSFSKCHVDKIFQKSEKKVVWKSKFFGKFEHCHPCIFTDFYGLNCKCHQIFGGIDKNRMVPWACINGNEVLVWLDGDSFYHFRPVAFTCTCQDILDF